MDLRTEQEVAEAFFSAGNGNMEMLNNMLGTQYKTFAEAQNGIAKNQGGLVDLMSETLPGLISTIGGKLVNGIKGIAKQFQEPLKGAFIGIIGLIDTMSPKIESFFGRIAKIDISGLFASFDFSLVTSALQPVTDLLDKMFIGIETKSPVTMGIMNILGTVFNVVFEAIGAIIKAIAPTIESIFNFIGEHGTEISTIIQALGSIWNAVWATVGPLLSLAWAIVEPLLDSLIGLLSTVGTWVKDIGNWWTDMADKIKNNPIVAKVSQVWDGVTADKTKPKKSKKSAFGTHRVVGDNVPYSLHNGERVLTRQEADNYDKGNNSQGIVINMNGVTIREEADIKKFAKSLVRELNNQKISFGGSY